MLSGIAYASFFFDVFGRTGEYESGNAAQSASPVFFVHSAIPSALN
jgi:hypothetical protein